MTDQGISSNVTTADFGATRLSSNALTWLKNTRHISQQTLAKLPVGSGTVFFPELNRKAEAVFFKYPDGYKARSFPEKAFTQKQGTTPCFWNLEAVLNGKLEDVYIVEGELDVCAVVECGIAADQVLGAPNASISGDPEVAIGYVHDALGAGLSKARRIIWCGDQDDKGRALCAAMAREFGPARFWHVDWPEGAKDANDYLRTDGHEATYALLKDGMLAWPTMGLFKLSELPEAAPFTLWRPGFDWGDRMFLAPGTLSVTTGHPGMGKTVLFGQIWRNVVHNYDQVACIASFETRPKPHIRRQLRSLWGPNPKREIAMDAADIAAADRWIDEHYLFIVHPERRPDLKWLLDEAEVAVVRHGARILQIDPWNRLEAARDHRQSETDYIAGCLRTLYNFANDFSCHVQVIAHPSKTESVRRGNPPELEDIAGSKHWDNMVDQGFVVHRPQLFDDNGNREYYAELHYRKARFEELGYATKFGLEYDPGMGRFGVCPLRPKKQRKKKREDDREDEVD